MSAKYPPRVFWHASPSIPARSGRFIWFVVRLRGSRSDASAGDWPVPLPALAFAAGYLAWQAGGFGGADSRPVIGDLAILGMNALAAWWCHRAALRSGSSLRLRRLWRMLSIALIAFLAGDAAQLVYELLGHKPYPSPADVAYLAFYPLTLLAVMSAAAGPRRAGDRLRLTLDAATVALGGGVAIWHIAIQPVAAAAPDGLMRAFSWAYPIGDLVLVAALAAVMLRPAQGLSKRTVALLAGAISGFVITDLVYARLALHGNYHGGDPVDIGWFLSLFAFGLAARAQREPRRLERGERYRDELPWATYLAAGIAYSMLIAGEAEGSFMKHMSVIVACAGIGLIVMARQLLAQRRLSAIQTDLTRARQHLATVVGAAPMLLFAFDEKGMMTLNEGRALAAIGHKPGDNVGKSIFEVCADLPDVLEAAQTALGGARTTTTIEWDELTFETYLEPVFAHDGSVEAVIGVSTDVTERQRGERRIAHMAFHDHLTGLPNRLYLQNELESALSRARRRAESLALLYIDLDRFKLVNDSFGHAAGDAVLCETAERLRAACRESDFVARQGGDEFMVLLESLHGDSAGHASAIAAKIIERLRAPFEIEGTEFELGATVGISLYPRDAQTPDSLMKHSDAAMYQARSAGRGGTAIYERSARDPRGQLNMGVRLRRAIPSGELVLHYQPIFNLATRAVVGVEALIRWEDPVLGLVPAGDFIPFAEDSGLIEDVGGWVIDEVCRQAAEWWGAGLEPHIAFNVSPRQFRSGQVGDQLSLALARYRIPGSALTVEITESAAMADEKIVAPALRQLAALGVRTSIDDFGAGFSSLDRLFELCVQELKLDRRFLEAVPRDARASALLGAVLTLARALDLNPVVEGIETGEQLDFLVRTGFRTGQGYHLCMPLPAAEVTPLLPHSGVASAWDNRVAAPRMP
jgi:diguanylate cyclase (GGDEF)-like protein